MMIYDGRVIAKAREVAGMRLTDLAIKLYEHGATRSVVSRQRIAKWEGESQPRASTLATMCRILGIPMESTFAEIAVAEATAAQLAENNGDGN